MRQDYNKATRSASHSPVFSVPSVVKIFSSIRVIRENPRRGSIYSKHPRSQYNHL
jgi:hypothetical protein